MDIERGYHKKDISQKELAQVLWNVSRRFTHGRWVDDISSSRYEFSRTIGEMIGEGLEYYDDEGKPLPPIEEETTITLTGYCAVAEDAIENEYTIRSHVVQSVTWDELPESIQEQLLEALRESAEDDEDDGYVMDYQALAPEDVEDREFSRGLEVSYRIDGDGEILEYTEDYSYVIDEEEYTSQFYSSNQEGFGMVATPTSRTIDANESRPAVVTVLTDTEAEQARINDVDIQTFIFEQDITEQLALGGVDTATHRRRIMGMMGLLLSDIVSIKKLMK